jgi:cell wall-associated NlpC family hydrolase
MREIIGGYLGTSYRSGGYGKLGIDCSGLVYAVYRDLDNRHLPPSTKKLFNTLRRVSYRDLRYGDLVFFSLNGKVASHVGLYVGDNKFVHASKKRGVIISSLAEEYYRQSYVGARRVTG